MSGATYTGTFKHDNDCVIYGCPGHEMTVTWHGPSDTITASVDGVEIYSGDMNTSAMLVELMNKVDLT